MKVSTCGVRPSSHSRVTRYLVLSHTSTKSSFSDSATPLANAKPSSSEIVVRFSTSYSSNLQHGIVHTHARTHAHRLNEPKLGWLSRQRCATNRPLRCAAKMSNLAAFMVLHVLSLSRIGRTIVESER